MILDDKIIFRAGRNYLLDEYRKAATDLAKVCLNPQSVSCQLSGSHCQPRLCKTHLKRKVFTCTLVASGHRGLGQGNDSGVSQARKAGTLVHQQLSIMWLMCQSCQWASVVPTLIWCWICRRFHRQKRSWPQPIHQGKETSLQRYVSSSLLAMLTCTLKWSRRV